jgi:hypothetical protein
MEGSWPSHFQINFKAPKNPPQAKLLQVITNKHDIPKLWPMLSLISAWDTANSKDFAQETQNVFSQGPLARQRSMGD